MGTVKKQYFENSILRFIDVSAGKISEWCASHQEGAATGPMTSRAVELHDYSHIRHLLPPGSITSASCGYNDMTIVMSISVYHQKNPTIIPIVP
jgi:hypothetical protein